MTAIENDAWNAGLQARLTELERRQATLEGVIAAGETENVPVALHPNTAEISKRMVADLAAASTDPEVCTQAGEALAALIDKIILTPAPDAADCLQIDLCGAFASILHAAGNSSAPNDSALRCPMMGLRRARLADVVSVVA